MKKYLVMFLLVSAVGFAQNLNGYKYAMVPAKFTFLKEENMYNLNLLTKMYLQKYGFETYYNNETAPDEFVTSNCNKIYIDVLENNNMLTTKLKIVVKDCKGAILATSEEGTSREKEYLVAYNLALRMALDNFGILKTHKFQPTEKSMGMIGKPSKSTEYIEKSDVLEKGLYSKKEDTLNQMVEKTYNIVPIKNGFNLITPASDYKIFQIFKTSSKEVFIANRDNVFGVLIKKTDNWFFEYYDENVLKSEQIKVAF
jgi:hypothetical protein